jgi:hypothetical protein
MTRRFIDRVNAVKITHEDMVVACEIMEPEPEGGRSFEATVVRLARAFPSEPQKVQAVVFRMQALGSLASKSRPGWWFLPSEGEGALSVSRLALQVAATLDLIEDGHSVSFDEGAFLELALQLAEEGGRG